MDDLELALLSSEEEMQNAISSYKNNLTRINTGSANPMILNSININYYDTPTPVNQLASITIHKGTQLIIKPFDPKIIKDIINLINNSSLGVTAQDEGDKIRIHFPIMTQEKRITLVKQMAIYTENAKINIRHARQVLNKFIKHFDLSEDIKKTYLEKMQNLTDKYIKLIDVEKTLKEKELLTI